MEHTFRLENGMVTYWENGSRVNVGIEARNDGRGLYKAWIRGDKGTMELGTLIPEQNSLRLRRSMPLENLRQAGCWPITECGLTLAHSFGTHEMPQGWNREGNPSRLFPRDPMLREATAGLDGCLICISREGFSLAVPFGNGKPFPLAPIFCFARIRMLGGRHYAVFAFEQDGSPRK